MAIQIQLRRGPASLWSSQNPILAEGEIAVDTTNYRFKVGDGVRPWNLLPFTDQGTLANLFDVQISTSPIDGSVMVYQTSINKWVDTIDLNKQVMDGGYF
jgi:hypothetical protein